MTGKDPVLNRRIASIFLNDLENFISVFSRLPSLTETDTVKSLIHKHSPSFIIFELETLLANYNSFLDRKINGETILTTDPDFQQVIDNTKSKIEEVRMFIAGLDI